MAQNVPQSRYQGQVQVEDILEPLDGGSRLVREYLDEVRPRLVTGRLESVVVELLDAILNLVVDLCPCQGAVDSRRGLGRVASEEACQPSEKLP